MRGERWRRKRLDASGGRWQREDGWPWKERQPEVRAAAPAMIRPIAVVFAFRRRRRVRCRLVAGRPSAFGCREPAVKAVVLMRQAGTMRRDMRTREALAEVRMVVAVRDEVRDRSQLSRKHEHAEHERRGSGSELGEGHLAARHVS
jgi:hypothetical protein